MVKKNNEKKMFKSIFLGEQTQYIGTRAKVA